jgi:ribonuclease BN (tRNA processing enzyme)
MKQETNMQPDVRVTRRALLGGAAAGLAVSALPLRAATPQADRWVLLGTAGGPVVRKSRSQPANLLQIGDRYYLIDLGAGVTRQLVLAGVDLHKIDVAFISHLHLDHSAGMASFVGLDWVEAGMRRLRKTPVAIYGPPGTRQVVKESIAAVSVQADIFRTQSSQAAAPETFFVAHEIDQAGPLEVYRDELLRVTAVENTHYSSMTFPQRPYGRDMSFSFRFETPRRSIVYTGDTGPSPAVEKLAQGADVLVSEVIDLPAVIANIAQRDGGAKVDRSSMVRHMELEHLTPENVGAIAGRAKVGKLVLTHFGLPSDSEALDTKSLLRAIRKHYSGPVVFGKDLLAV